MSSLACVHCAHRGVQFPSEAVFRGSPGMCTAPRGWLSWCPSCMWRGQPGVRFPQMGEVGQRHPSLGLTARDTHPPKPGMCIATMTTSLRTWAPTSNSSAYWKCRTWTLCCSWQKTANSPAGATAGAALAILVLSSGSMSSLCAPVAMEPPSMNRRPHSRALYTLAVV